MRPRLFICRRRGFGNYSWAPRLRHWTNAGRSANPRLGGASAHSRHGAGHFLGFARLAEPPHPVERCPGLVRVDQLSAVHLALAPVVARKSPSRPVPVEEYTAPHRGSLDYAGVADVSVRGEADPLQSQWG